MEFVIFALIVIIIFIPTHQLRKHIKVRFSTFISNDPTNKFDIFQLYYSYCLKLVALNWVWAVVLIMIVW